MTIFVDPECPACSSPLNGDACTSCGARVRVVDGILDLRLHAGPDAAPHPLELGDLDVFLDDPRPSRTSFKAHLESLLLALPDERAELLMQILREARGAWFPLLASKGGTLLFLGNSLSGAITPLADAGFEITSLERSLERARFANARNEAHSPGRTRMLLGGHAPRLPFADGTFDVVVCEDGLPDEAQGYASGLDECRRVARGEVVLLADNRLGYKRSSGKRSDFRVPRPLEFARLAARPERGERTLLGYRRLLSGNGFARARAFALYPHLHDYSHVVAIDARTPALTIGPMERKNRTKLAARAVGLFPVFTPSFALVAARAGSVPKTTRIERMLAEIAERTGEPLPEIEQLVGTRGNTAIVHTRLPSAADDESRGRWTLHIPLAPKNQPQVERHYAFLELLRARFPALPVPEPLWIGRVDGVSMACERRASGWTAPQQSGDRRLIGRMLREVSAHFARLVTRPAAPLSHAEFEEQVGGRFDRVIRYASVLSTITKLRRLRDEMRERLVGRAMPRVVYHADLRAKHVQIDRDGHVVAILDWGTAEVEGLPYYDLLQLLVHERKQEENLSPANAWRIVRERKDLRDDEREALDGYAQVLGLDDETRRAIEAMYPVLVAAMAETHWDYSRPRWLHRQFGI